MTDRDGLATQGLVIARGGARLLDDLSLALPGGGVSVVMGPNGAGKSLLLRALHGLIEPDAGAVLSGETRLEGADGAAARARQAMVFQRPVLLRRTVSANLAFALRLRSGRRPRDSDILAQLEQVRLAEKARRPARALSGGEQQRLALARALATEPDTLLLDEPTASLDPASAALIEEVIAAAAARGVKVVLVTHDLGQARRLAHDVAFLHRGRLVAQAPADDFFRDPPPGPARDFLAGRLVL